MLAIGRALMSRPKLIMIDEPSLGLAPLVIDRVYAILAELRAQAAVTIMIVEQNTARIADIADRIHVVRNGRIVLSGSPAGNWRHHFNRRRVFWLHRGYTDDQPLTPLRLVCCSIPGVIIHAEGWSGGNVDHQCRAMSIPRQTQTPS